MTLPLMTKVIIADVTLCSDDLKYLSFSQEPVSQEGEGQSPSGAEGSRLETFWESPTKGSPH